MIYHWRKQDAPVQKLGSFLQQVGFSRTQLKQLKYHAGLVFVNHKRRYFDYLVRQNDEIWVRLPNENSSPKIVPQAGPLSILYEDDNYLILNKPAGLASLPARGQTTPALANLVKFYLQSQHQNDVIHLISRLDRDTSGIISLAKNAYAHYLLASEFRTAAVKKEYLALVTGTWSNLPTQGTITFPIGVDPQNHNLRCVDPQGQPALTKYQVLDCFPHYTVLKIALVTGRTHQIRVHCAAMGHPLLGDRAYGGSTHYIARQALHCRHFTFWHQIQRQQIQIWAPVPTDIQAML